MITEVHLPPLNSLTGSPTQVVLLTAQQQRAILMGKLTRLVLFCYVLMLFKPVMPLITDGLAHTFWEKQHMMAVHEVNGKFHIHGELGRASHQSDNEKSNELKYEVEQYVYTAPSIFKATVESIQMGDHVAFTFHYPHTYYNNIISPPPQTVAQNKISEAMNDGSLFRA